MSRLMHHPRFGNLSTYDVRSVINVRNLQSDFNRLTVDPYLRDGYRRKHILRLKHTEKGYVKLPLAPLYQPLRVNPTHGDIQRHYPEFHSEAGETVKRILDLFMELAQVPDEETVLFQAQRITCSLNVVGLPSVEDWHEDLVTKVGVLCVDRENIRGGVSEFRMNDNHNDVISTELSPGHMVIWEDDKIQHRVTPITPYDHNGEGYRDVILLAYGNVS